MKLNEMVNNLALFYFSYKDKKEDPLVIYNVWVQTNNVPVKNGADAVFLLDFISKLQKLTVEEIEKALMVENIL